MPRYSVRLNVSMDAEDEADALRCAAAFVQYWNSSEGTSTIRGIGDAVGYVVVVEPEATR